MMTTFEAVRLVVEVLALIAALWKGGRMLSGYMVGLHLKVDRIEGKLTKIDNRLEEHDGQLGDHDKLLRDHDKAIAYLRGKEDARHEDSAKLAAAAQVASALKEAPHES